jgi:hypothetical protein
LGEAKMKRLVLTVVLILGSFIFVFGGEEIIIGREDGDGILIYPRQIGEGPDGNIYVYDLADAFIKVYSPEGKFLRKIGGKGQGPGEIQRPEGVSFGFTLDDKLFFTEYFGGHPWITFMELSGKFHKVLKPELKEFFGVSRAVSLQDGGFLAQFSFTGMPEKRKDYFIHSSPTELVILDSEGRIISRIKKTSYFTRISYFDSGRDSPIPFTPVFLWCPFKNNTVIFTEGLSTKLKVYDYKGTFVKEINTPLSEPEKVTKDDLDEWRRMRKESVRDKQWYNRFGKVIEKYKKSIYEKRPNLIGISLTPDGNIFISGLWDDEAQRRNYWLIDKNGNTITKISTQYFELEISKHFVFYGTRDEEENILVLCLKRTGTEKEDLLRLEKK